MQLLGKITTYPNNWRVSKALIAAKYNGLEIEQTGLEMGVTNQSAEFLAKFPMGKVPAFEGSDGFTLYESNAIAYYAASAKENTQLLGKNKQQAALVQQFISLADNELCPLIGTWLYPIMGYTQNNVAATEKAKTDIKRVLTALNSHLSTRTFFVGECVTLADITLACTLLSLYKLVFDASFRAPYINLNRWFVTCVNQPFFKAVLGEVALCEKMAVAPEKKPEPKKEVPVVKKEEKKPKAKKEDDDEEMEESYEDEKPKAKNPLDLLPKSSFNLEEWKRFYSNNETRPTACNWFWENYDKEGFSIWKVDYKYNNELTMTFMSSNLVGGFFQRLENSRKYAFGSMLICGTNNDSVISGYFVFRGHGVPAEVLDVPDYESYAFTRVNEEDAKVREDFNAVIAWDATIEGKAFADGKVFK